MADKKRTIQDGYEVIQAVKFGGTEIIMAQNKNIAEAPYMVCDCVWNKDLCHESIKNAMGGTDFVEVMKLFAARISERAVSVENEREIRAIPFQTLTAADCRPVGKTDLKGCAVVIKPELLAPEYRSIDYQLALCTGGFGASPDSNGRAVYCQNLITGETTRYNRSDIAGTLSNEQLPDWASINLAALQSAAMNESGVTAAEPLTKEQFWQMIDTARETAGRWQDMLEPLIEAISRLEEPDIIRFNQIYDEYHELAYKKKLWDAALLIRDGCSDDGFHYFRAWLIAQGKEAFMNALADPDSLADLKPIQAFGQEVKKFDYTDQYTEDPDFEFMSYAAIYAYEKKFGKDADIYAAIDTNPLSEQEKAGIAADIIYAPDIDVKTAGIGIPWDETLRELKNLLPKLYKMFNRDEPPELFPDVLTSAAKESVLEKIKQEREKTGGQKPKTKSKKHDKKGLEP